LQGFFCADVVGVIVDEIVEVVDVYGRKSRFFPRNDCTGDWYEYDLYVFLDVGYPRLPSPPQINSSVRESVRESVRPSVSPSVCEYMPAD